MRKQRPLTPRQEEVLRLFGEGLCGKQIAARLNITPQMVSKYRKVYGRKLGLHSWHQVIRHAAVQSVAAQ